MKIVCIGGGPAGLYASMLLKKADPSRDVVVYERQRAGETVGFGVVFSDATLGNLQRADPESYTEILRHFKHWDDIEVHYRDSMLRSTGHGFAGFARQKLLDILTARCAELDVRLHFEHEITDLSQFVDADLLLLADGINSGARDSLRSEFETTVDWRPNRFVWLGTTRPFPSFTFYFKTDAHGLWRVHAYQYDAEHSTFIVETTEETWRAAGLDGADEQQTIEFCEALFAAELQGHRLLNNHSIWRQFPTVTNRRWHSRNLVLLGDAAHSAHFSVGSGTKLALEDGIVLAESLSQHDEVETALAAYERVRRPEVESLQRAAQCSLEWFEQTERYLELEPMQFAFSLLTRSLRISHENLRLRDPEFVNRVDRWFAGQSGQTLPDPVPAPMFTRFRLRDLTLSNRVVVSPMCMYSADDGTVNDWHLVHLGSRAIGGAGLVIAEMTDVSPEGRISAGCAGMYKPEHLVAWKRVVDFVHRYSNAAIGIQIGHAGRKASCGRMAEGGRPLTAAQGAWPLIAPSALAWGPQSQLPSEMDRSEMDRIREAFVQAAQMCDQAGFDLLELHCAHGYLLASFISPLTNQRRDEYGGSLENRMRYPLEVLDAVRDVWPAAKPISVRISAVDWAPGGSTPKDAVDVARLLKQHECDIIDVSSGMTVPSGRPQYGRLFQTPFADKIRHEAGIPTMAVGNISSYMDVNSILAAGRADLVVMARAHLWHPYWTRHAAYEQGHRIPWPPQYVVLNDYTPRFK